MKSILDPKFRYTSSANTDLRKTFARIRYENSKQEIQRQADKIEAETPMADVTSIRQGHRDKA